MNNHKNDFRKYKDGQADKTEVKTLYAHLATHGQSKFKVQIVDYIYSHGQTKDQLHKELNKRERDWIWKLDTVYPKGLNTDDGFYTQNKRSRNNTRIR